MSERMVDRNDSDLMRDRQLIPRNPFEVEATKSIVQRHIEAGDIEQGDIELLKNSYRMVSTISFLGSAVMGGGSYWYMKNRMPMWKMGPRLMFAGGMGMLGSFVGFAIGGVGAAMEVNSKMQDPQRKMKVFADIALESKKAIEEARMGGMRAGGAGAAGAAFPSSLPGRLPSKSADNGEQTWDAEGTRERREEADREQGLRNEVGRIEGDSGNTERNPARGIANTVKQETTSAWDKIRSDRPAVRAPAPGYGGAIGGPAVGQSSSALGGSIKEDERTREQRDFDELLEKERQGVGANEVWK